MRNSGVMVRVTTAIAALASLTACNGTAPSYRYKETVVVETPQGIRTGSTVIEVQMAYVNFGSETNLLPSRFKGEAAAVDLPNGKVLFALLSSPEHPDWAKTAYQFLIPQQPFQGKLGLKDSPELKQYQMAMDLKGPQVLPRYRKANGAPSNESAYPRLVTFQNLNDPTTVAAVDPDNLAASFGSGYRMKAIVLERTDEPTTDAIRSRIFWMGQYPEPHLDPSKNLYATGLADSLTRGDFSTFAMYR